MTYRNKQGIKLNYPLSQSLSKYDPEMSKRLKYTKDILSDILKQSQPNNNINIINSNNNTK